MFHSLLIESCLMVDSMNVEYIMRPPTRSIILYMISTKEKAE